MIRQCAVSTTAVQAVQRKDGSWTVEGVEAEQFVDTLLIMQRLAFPFNSSFFVTLSPKECLERLKNNESDFSHILIPLSTDSSFYHASQTILPGKIQFVTGYNTSEDGQVAKDSATVFTNVELLQPEVYLCSLFLLFCLFNIVIMRLWIHRRQRLQLKSGRRPLALLVKREMSGIFYHSSNHFKFITFLYALFCFYVVTSFLCVYKTSHVIAEKPFYPTSYKESLEHKTSVIGWYDQFVIASESFRFAPPRSLKGRLWKKMLASGKEQLYRVDPATTSPTALPALISGFSRAIVHSKDICVVSSIAISLLKSLACGFSPEGQLWFLKIFSDPIEQELVYGYAMASAFSASKVIEKSLQRAFEGHILAHHYKLSFEITHIANRLAGTGKQHQWKQYLACNHEDALIPKVEVHAIHLSYFHSFFIACSLIWSLAFILNFAQIMIFSKKSLLPSLSRYKFRHR